LSVTVREGSEPGMEDGVEDGAWKGFCWRGRMYCAVGSVSMGGREGMWRWGGGGKGKTYGWARGIGARVLDVVGWDLGRFGVEG
jgi:hypothetical protein